MYCLFVAWTRTRTRKLETKKRSIFAENLHVACISNSNGTLFNPTFRVWLYKAKFTQLKNGAWFVQWRRSVLLANSAQDASTHVTAREPTHAAPGPETVRHVTAPEAMLATAVNMVGIIILHTHTHTHLYIGKRYARGLCCTNEEN